MRIPAVLLFLATLLPPAATHATSTGPAGAEQFELWFLADITIAPDGSVSNQAWRNFTRMPGPALADLEGKIATWKFQPGSVDGVPAETETSLVIRVLAIKRHDGRFRLEVANATTGPSLLEGRWPELDIPEPWWSGYGSGAQAFDVTVPPGGPPTIEFGEYIADTRRSRFKAGFRLRAQDIVDHWVVRHERVAGRPVVARFRHAVYHCRSVRWCAGETGHWGDGLPEMPARQPIPLQSVTKVLAGPAS